MDDGGLKAISLPIEWHIPEDIKAECATHLVIQHSQHEFYIYFFRAALPVVIGSPEEKAAYLQELGSIRADCVGHIVVPASRMSEFVQVFQDNLESYLAKPVEDVEEAGE